MGDMTHAAHVAVTKVVLSAEADSGCSLVAFPALTCRANLCHRFAVFVILVPALNSILTKPQGLKPSSSPFHGAAKPRPFTSPFVKSVLLFQFGRSRIPALPKEGRDAPALYVTCFY